MSRLLTRRRKCLTLEGVGHRFRVVGTALQIQPWTKDILRAWRARHGLTQEAVARLLEMSLKGYALWEKDDAAPLTVRQTLALEALDVRLDKAARETAAEQDAKTARKSSTLNRKG